MDFLLTCINNQWLIHSKNLNSEDVCVGKIPFKNTNQTTISFFNEEVLYSYFRTSSIITYSLKTNYLDLRAIRKVAIPLTSLRWEINNTSEEYFTVSKKGLFIYISNKKMVVAKVKQISAKALHAHLISTEKTSIFSPTLILTSIIPFLYK